MSRGSVGPEDPVTSQVQFRDAVDVQLHFTVCAKDHAHSAPDCCASSCWCWSTRRGATEVLLGGLPDELEICARVRDGVACRSVVTVQLLDGSRWCYRCGGTDPGVLYRRVAA